MRLKHFIRLSVVVVLLAGALALVSSPGPVFTTADKAYYADPNMVDFVRPGLVIKVTGAEIAADGTIKARLKLTDPAGLPLDRLGATSPGTVSVSLIAAQIPKGQTQYVAYTTRVQTSPITGVSETQAGTDSGGAWEAGAAGEYVYTFRTRAPSSIDRTVTHSIGAYGSRNLTSFGLVTYYSNDVFSFVPNGSPVAVVRDVIRTATCNKCHDQMGFHGGSRRTMEVCILCHTPQTVDPDTGNTMDMAVMIHKIHSGSKLPSVVAGTPYKIIGNSQSVHDYSKVNFPADTRNCGVCHEAGPAQADNVYKPNREACRACHDDINWATGEGHVDLPQYSDNMCAGCHPKQGEVEFDASILGGHMIPRFSKSLPGIVFELLGVDNAKAGAKPTVRFQVKDSAGKPVQPSSLSRLTIRLGGPNTDYTWTASETALTAAGPAGGPYSWTFAAALPTDAKGSYSVEIEGRRDTTLMQGTKKQVAARDTGQNKVMAFSVDGSPVVARRTVVSIAKCNACHAGLALHGEARNQIEGCVMCHNPAATNGTPVKAIDFRVMIHRIHTGAELQIPYSFGTSANFNEVGYPGDRRNCAFCHVNNSEQLPLAQGRQPVADPIWPVNPLPAATAACLGCHTSADAVSHAISNISQLGESCSVCHGNGREFGVSKAHAR